MRALEIFGKLRKIRQDLITCQSGNVMIMAAASVVPLLVLGGSALDIGRMMLVKNRLQHACDAATLAYRRSMNGNNVVAITEPNARSFFNANFNSNRYGAGAPTISFSVDSNVVVHGTASVAVPMTIMRVFGKDAATINVTSDAQLQLPNADVMFVLDTTGSMTDKARPADPTSKIVALRTAVKGFYAALEAAKVAGTQIRYGFVPYSNTVNVGMLLNRNWMVDRAIYQSRQFNTQTSTTTAGVVTTDTGWIFTPHVTRFYSTGSPENCVPEAPTATYNSQTTTITTTNPSTGTITTVSTYYVNGTSYLAQPNANGTCTLIKVVHNNSTYTRTQTTTPNSLGSSITLKNYWDYLPVTFDVSAFKGSNANGLMAGGTFNAPISTPTGAATTGAPYPITWNASNACIEERQTARPGETVAAYDENVDLVPTPGTSAAAVATQWRPFLPGLVFARSVTTYSTTALASGWPWSSSPVTKTGANYVQLDSLQYSNAACPSAARKLRPLNSPADIAALDSYIDSLETGGDTYHDIGFLWGLRLSSQYGLFAAENAVAPNGFDISRNIVFMTDGATDTHIQDYDAYGLSALDRRRTGVGSLPVDSDQNTIVETRLLQYCSAAKARGFTVWVVAFATNLTPALNACANASHAYKADDSAALNAAFLNIAGRIAQLRLTK